MNILPFLVIRDDYYICNKNPICFNKICNYCYEHFTDSVY